MELLVNKTDLQSLTLVEPTRQDPVLDPLYPENWLYFICALSYFTKVQKINRELNLAFYLHLYKKCIFLLLKIISQTWHESVTYFVFYILSFAFTWFGLATLAGIHQVLLLKVSKTFLCS